MAVFGVVVGAAQSLAVWRAGIGFWGLWLWLGLLFVFDSDNDAEENGFELFEAAAGEDPGNDDV